MLKIAKKVVLRQLRPDIPEKEQREMEQKAKETSAASLKVKVGGKEVERITINAAPVRSASTVKETKKEESAKETEEITSFQL